MCAKSCRGLLRTGAIALGVIVRTPGMHIPLVPAQFAPQGSFGKPVRGCCGLPLVIVYDHYSITFPDNSPPRVVLYGAGVG